MRRMLNACVFCLNILASEFGKAELVVAVAEAEAEAEANAEAEAEATSLTTTSSIKLNK